MKEHYLPLKQDEDELIVSGRTYKPEKQFVPWLPAINTLLLSLVLFTLFGMPCTLLIYLSFLVVYAFAGCISLLGKVAFQQQRLLFTPLMGVAFALVVFPLLVPSMMPPHPAAGLLQSSNPTGRSANATTPATPHNVLFVAANLYNSEAILPRFSASLLELAKAVGEDNIFISIYESNSKDKTKTMLSRFNDDLIAHEIPHHIEMATTNDHIGVEGNYNRIDFLAKTRNRVYEALEVQPGANYKARVNKVLWLNDVLFDSSSALDLLNTNEGRYDVACGLDYIPLGVYDTWVVRDMNLRRLKPIWPHFESSEDVERLKSGQPIRVKSCWNGIAAFNADLLLDGRPMPFANTSTPSRQDGIAWPLRFRKSGECLTSECLLINYDLHLLLANDRQPEIYINPTVQVAYEKMTFFMYSRLLHWRIVKPWHYIWQDWIANRVFGFVTDLGRKPANCAIVLDAGFNHIPHTQ